MADVAQYSFVPWLRQGLASRIAEPDVLGGNPGATAGRASVTAELALDYLPREGDAAGALPAIPKRIELLGPGDVVAIAPEAILRTEPARGAVDATPGELAYVEFYEEDFPWRYTPARVATAAEPLAGRHKLRPWIALWVLLEDEFELVERPGAAPVITLAATADLPSAGEIWAWAHAQLSKAVPDAAAVAPAIASAPDHALARLICPRRLEAGRAYHAFVVPAFETGRLAGLGEPDPAVPAQQASWGTPATQADRRYPVYHRWTFTTGTLGDFETLVRLVEARPAGQELGKRPLDVRRPGYQLTPPADAPDTVELEGALRPPELERDPFPDVPGEGFAQALEEVVDLSETLRLPGSAVPDDPIVTPPAYGRWHAGLVRVAEAAGDASLAWLRELNLDPRSRAAAGLGAEVIRQRQEELMERAWKQVGQLQDANQRLREAELATAAASALHGKHIVAAPADRAIILTAAAQPGLAAPGERASVRGVVDASRVPAATQSATFKRITRPQRRLMRRLTGGGDVEAFQGGLISGMNLDPGAALSTAPPRPEPDTAVSLPAVKLAVTIAATEFESEVRPWQVFLELVQADLAARRSRPQPEDLGQLQVPVLKAALHAALAARGATVTAAAAATVRQLIDAIQAIAPDGPDAATITLPPADFRREFGNVPGKTLRGATIAPAGAPPAGPPARATSLDDIQRYGSDLAAFDAGVVAARPDPVPRAELPQSGLEARVRDGLSPRRELTRRVAAALPGLEGELAARPEGAARALRPVMAHPTFPDPMVEPLRALSIDHVLPNAADLPPNTITLMKPNPRFIESYLAGLNDELARELLWREYPTDQRGSYLRVFWDTRDAVGHQSPPDVKALHEWDGELGGQSVRPPDSLVLVVRAALLQKYPNLVVYVQEAEFPGGDTTRPRSLRAGGAVEYPAFSATLAPDLSVWGFNLTEGVARGHRPTGPWDPAPARPGWFFVLKERPGQVRFALDADTPAHGLDTWDDLAWDAIQFAAGTSHLALAPNAGLTPATPQAATWATSSADMAAILFQSPILYARHAEELLPV